MTVSQQSNSAHLNAFFVVIGRNRIVSESLGKKCSNISHLFSCIFALVETMTSSMEDAGNRHPKLYNTRGAHYTEETGMTTFRVHAPNAKATWIILTAFGRQEHQIKMEQIDIDIWEAITSQALPGRTYLYLIENCHGKRMLRTDPVSFSVVYIPQVHQIQSVVHDQTAYQWSDQQWMSKRALIDPLRSPLSIYEIQSKTWKSGVHRPMNFRQMAPDLVAYCHKMGFTHVEMFSVLEHADRGERGYRVANYFAPYHDNGLCDDLKYLVDCLHQNNIGVILDWIPTHFQHFHESDQFSISLHEFDGTNLHASHASPWGTLYFDFSREETRQLIFASALYFLDEMHMDGIRFDAVSQMVRRDSKDIIPAISFLRQLNQTIRRCYPGVLRIAEETEGYPDLSKSMHFDLKWNIGWSHDTRNLLRTPYAERPQHWQHKVMNVLNHAVTSQDKMILTSSHDDSDSGAHNNNRVLWRCVAHARNDEERFADLRNYFAWQVLAPSRGHMIHMGEEFVQPTSWYQRFCQGLSSTDWSLADPSSGHGKMQDYVARLNKFYIDHAQCWQNGERDFTMIYEYGPNLVLAYHRGVHASRRIAVIHNFSNRGYHSYNIPLPRWDPLVARIQKITEVFNSDDPIYGGSGKFRNEELVMVNDDDRGNARLLKVMIPPLGTIVFEEFLN